jgi:protein-L-isoaspartate(D-aspartate) O-methyltransferase
MTDLDIIRRAYARHIFFISGSDDPRLEAALAEIRREDFMGPGPWDIGVTSGYRRTPDAEPHWLYQNALVALIAEKQLNNGMPDFLVSLISLARAQPGEHAVHIGAGVGYYTAFLAHLVGASGQVTAIEYEPDLAARARANLSPYPQVHVAHGDGAATPLAPADVILVNAGASRPADLWLDALKDGGRLIVPLCVGFKLPNGTPMTRGAIFLIERQGATYTAAHKSPTAIYPCIGVGDSESEASLTAALRKGGMEKVRRLYRGDAIDPDRCWAQGPGWALAYD